ncbi:MAG: transposase [Saprospiraceae bacterium]|nr:transposase [Saprospiraceae bacterium]
MGRAYYILQQWNTRSDNNLIENQIRPLALGRKNFMFAASHQSRICSHFLLLLCHVQNQRYRSSPMVNRCLPENR